MKNIIGQLTNEEFEAKFPNAIIRSGGRATTKSGKHTTNYWIRHEDMSWTNYDCKTSYN